METCNVIRIYVSQKKPCVSIILVSWEISGSVWLRHRTTDHGGTEYYLGQLPLWIIYRNIALFALLPFKMDNSLFRDLKVSRGFNYGYYYSPPSSGKPTLLFLHGFPSSSHDWNRQINYFQSKGYGIVAPDLLGAGRTSRPVEVKAFRLNQIAVDIIEILDKHNIDKVIGICHDWWAFLFI